jgi:hypothetical protein
MSVSAAWPWGLPGDRSVRSSRDLARASGVGPAPVAFQTVLLGRAVVMPDGEARPRRRGPRRECESLDQVLADVRAGHSRVLVLRGEAGVGKTALLDYVQERSAGCRVARAAGVESEMELAFAGLHQLCMPMVDRMAGLPALPDMVVGGLGWEGRLPHDAPCPPGRLRRVLGRLTRDPASETHGSDRARCGRTLHQSAPSRRSHRAHCTQRPPIDRGNRGNRGNRTNRSEL